MQRQVAQWIDTKTTHSLKPHLPAEVSDGILLEESCIVALGQPHPPAAGCLLHRRIVLRPTQEPAEGRLRQQGSWHCIDVVGCGRAV